MLGNALSLRRIRCDGRDSFIYRSCLDVPCRQLPHAPENPTAALSASEKRAIDLAWAKPFDGNSPLIRYILEVSENSKSHNIQSFPVMHQSIASEFIITDGPGPVRVYAGQVD